MPIRQWYVSEALHSMRRLEEIIDEVSHDEVIAALALESGSRRRKSIINRLISRAVRLNELEYSNKLKELYHGTPNLENPVRR